MMIAHLPTIRFRGSTPWRWSAAPWAMTRPRSADYLADCARGLLGQGRVEWTSHNEIIIDCVVGPLSQAENRSQPPGPEQLEQAIRSRLGNRLVGATPGVHVKGELGDLSGRSGFLKPFGWRSAAWQLESAPGEDVTPTGPEWSVEINFKLIKFRLSQLIAALRADGGLLEAGLERLRSLGRASASCSGRNRSAAGRSNPRRPNRRPDGPAGQGGPVGGEDARSTDLVQGLHASRLCRRGAGQSQFDCRPENARKHLVPRGAAENLNSGRARRLVQRKTSPRPTAIGKARREVEERRP